MEDLDVGFWTNRQVFVTGATGLLGSWLTKGLVQKGARVVCLVRDRVPDSRLFVDGILDRVVVVSGELEDYDVVLRSLNEYSIDTVFHLGAQTQVGVASRSALSTFESNIKGTWNVLEASRACSRLVKRVVVASSDKAYGAHDALPYTEDTPLLGRFPYDVSKSCADLLSQSYYHTHDLPVVVTRCGNLFGGGDLNFERLVPGTIRSVLANENPVVRSDGTAVRDYFYVRDAVSACLRLAERLHGDSLMGEVFNIGSEQPLSVLDLVRMITRLAGTQSLTPRILADWPHEIPRQYLDCSKSVRLLKWRPQYSLEKALAETMEWYRNYLDEPGA